MNKLLYEQKSNIRYNKRLKSKWGTALILRGTALIIRAA